MIGVATTRQTGTFIGNHVVVVTVFLIYIQSNGSGLFERNLIVKSCNAYFDTL